MDTRSHEAAERRHGEAESARAHSTSAPAPGPNAHLDPTMPLPDLYACERCQLIGLRVTALAHAHATGHAAERVSDELADGVRLLWALEGRSLIDGAPCSGSTFEDAGSDTTRVLDQAAAPASPPAAAANPLPKPKDEDR